eukprot:TRINITY_DN6160_c0_g1_i1.p1 TRINITY_DN6160_c0_g1~~TRINITY_DN6160_c0_g1_i1.p1  ORF type:complete len:236 (+),score=39.35 TRINITY_DN6160_c0_g1_i1:224-931(+)
MSTDSTSKDGANSSISSASSSSDGGGGGGGGGGHTIQLVRHHRRGNPMLVAAYRIYHPLHIVNYAKQGLGMKLKESLASITEVVVDGALYVIFKQDWSKMDRSDTGSIFRATKYDDKEATVVWWISIDDGEFRSDHKSKEDAQLIHTMQEWYEGSIEAPYYSRSYTRAHRRMNGDNRDDDEDDRNDNEVKPDPLEKYQPIKTRPLRKLHVPECTEELEEKYDMMMEYTDPEDEGY